MTTNVKLPNLKHLQYLVALHKTQHFNRAAQSCHISQSALSVAIQLLEETCNTAILERQHKSFSFTPFGLELVERSKKLLHHADDWHSFATSGGDWRVGNLKLGMIPTIAPFMFRPVLSALRVDLPELAVSLEEDTTSNLLAKLQDGSIDMALLALPMATPNCRQMVLGQDPFYMVINSNYPLLNQLDPTQLSIDDLPENSIFLMKDEHCLSEHAISACRLEHKAQVSDIRASSIHTLVSLVESNMGVTFLPELALSIVKSSDDLQTFPIQHSGSRELGLVWREGTSRLRLFRHIGEMLQPLVPVPASQ